MTTTLNPNQLQQDLRQFTGSEEFYRHSLNRQVIFTEGVMFLAEQAKAHWLIDAVASYVGTRAMRGALEQDGRLRSLQFWHLQVGDDRTAVLTCRADEGVPAAVTQNIHYTDFPLPSVDLWAGFNGQGWTLYLPSEH